MHIIFHFLIPAVVVGLFFRKKWQSTYLILISTMLIDMDHLLANPVYDPERCSIGYHPLHGLLPIVLYCLLCFIPKTHIVGIGLVIHMILDAIDCQLSHGVWFV